MESGKFNVLLDGFWGSSGKGKISTWLADKFGVTHVSSSNFPNAGHTAQFGNNKFVSKAIPTPACLKAFRGMDMSCYLSPGSGFNWDRLIQEWQETGRPQIYVHDRASIVNELHAAREREGKDSTKHIASTMQGSGAAISDKVMRKQDVLLAGNDQDGILDAFKEISSPSNIEVINGMYFRNLVHSIIDNGNTWLHEGSQGYSLSIDHGSHYPHCTSRNCTLQAAMDHMAIPPLMVGDVYLNLRTFPIRVGNVLENGVEVGFSGDFYDDQEELSWEEVAEYAGMPQEEREALAERERTTVTKRIRRVANFTFTGLKDAVQTNGATKLALNFVQYLDWNDQGLRGEEKAFQKLSKKTRDLIDKIEVETNVPVVIIGTGADNDDIISLL